MRAARTLLLFDPSENVRNVSKGGVVWQAAMSITEITHGSYVIRAQEKNIAAQGAARKLALDIYRFAEFEMRTVTCNSTPTLLAPVNETL